MPGPPPMSACLGGHPGTALLVGQRRLGYQEVSSPFYPGFQQGPWASFSRPPSPCLCMESIILLHRIEVCTEAQDGCYCSKGPSPTSSCCKKRKQGLEMLRGRDAPQVTAESKHKLSLLPHALGFDHELASMTVFGGRDIDCFLPPRSPLKHMKGNKVQQRPQWDPGATLEKGLVPWEPLIPNHHLGLQRSSRHHRGHSGPPRHSFGHQGSHPCLRNRPLAESGWDTWGRRTVAFTREPSHGDLPKAHCLPCSQLSSQLRGGQTPPGQILTHSLETNFIPRRQGALCGQLEAAGSPWQNRRPQIPQRRLEAPGPQPQLTSQSGRTASQHHTAHSPQDRPRRAALGWRCGLRCGHRPPGPQ